VEYCDAAPREETIRHFPELKLEDLVEVTTICDLDQDPLTPFQDAQFDFVILNHVIEHVANPIRVVEALFRIVKPGGKVVLSAPDKRFTFDRLRQITPFAHLKLEYRNGVTQVSDEHYHDFLLGIQPQLRDTPLAELQPQLQRIRQRREHVHVWDSDAFIDFLAHCFDLLGIQAKCEFEHGGAQNYFEYFSVWRKLSS